MAILTGTTYYTSVRLKLGATENDISNEAIDDVMVMGVAEASVIRLVPDYASITDTSDLLYLKAAVISRVASLLCPQMASKYKVSVTTIDVKWTKDKINWEHRAAMLEAESTSSIAEIQTVITLLESTSDIFKIARSARFIEEGSGG